MSVAAAAPGQPMSWAEYSRRDPDPPSEYIDGCLVMAPSPTREHQQVCVRLANGLAEVVPPGHEVTIAWAWKAGHDEFIPDVMVHPSTDENTRFTGIPLLVVEVLSSNRADDLVLKTGKYARAGAPHYWIIDPRDRRIDAYDLADGIFRPVAHIAPGERTKIRFGDAAYEADVSTLLG